MDGRHARGVHTRRITLARAVDIATVDGLEGLTLGRLAADLQLSKSGIFAHFGSKEDLQLATISFAEEVFTEHVLRPAFQAPRGKPRLLALFDRWMDFSRARVFVGGCFFSAVTAEFDARDGKVHDVVVRWSRVWNELLARLVAECVEEGHMAEVADVDQLVFELNALGRAANHDSLLTREDSHYDRALTAVRSRLGAPG
ncbi:TetR/AcrR family transcriptional regulator [Actinokineospora globicatena]|uniref:TetR family transcriptional regulator n=1 Tax=Actinokineospora globicatena TaxID=103729 RepID=A0A9W6VB78_9PSEU|nr:TetR/AcrR family transcriptional regulator [Actinokineospora globicatena]MCP2300666.1 transcriptional regulator, TetR family [Actinokineospora globicatena]GLW81210.1 TetR family transcriptional regulator [Actinokineospora globicatena]GLW88403.1 TetR family transcriptional regulator [Actinokineospora globicatena]GLW92871.1 TetR family transcriptional regulator [Actinokineospora globicatena]